MPIQNLKQSTSAEVPIYLYDVSDGITPITGVVAGGVTAYTSQNGAAEASYTVTGKWTEIGHGVYSLTLDATITNTTGTLFLQITDSRATFLDFNAAYRVETGTLSDLETKIDTIDVNLDTVKDTDLPAVKTETAAIKARTDVINTATEDNTAHGSGSWEAGTGAGPYSVTFHVKDGGAVDIGDAIVSIHNATNDDGALAQGTTDNLGNIVLDVGGDIYIRVFKGGISHTPETTNITASGTYEVVVAQSVLPTASNPALSRASLVVYTISGALVTSGLTLAVSTKNDLSRDSNDQFATNDSINMVYDSGSGRWWIDLIRDMSFSITSEKVYGKDDNDVLISHDFNTDNDSATDLGVVIL